MKFDHVRGSSWSCWALLWASFSNLKGMPFVGRRKSPKIKKKKKAAAANSKKIVAHVLCQGPAKGNQEVLLPGTALIRLIRSVTASVNTGLTSQLLTILQSHVFQVLK